MPQSNAQPIPLLAKQQNYDLVCAKNKHTKHQLTLVSATDKSPMVEVIYRWKDNLSAQDASMLKDRARSYIACAIYDAAVKAGLTCKRPPSMHVDIPEWHLEEERISISIVDYSFDDDKKTIVAKIGPVLSIKRGPNEPTNTFTKLAQGFLSQFKTITV